MITNRIEKRPLAATILFVLVIVTAYSLWIPSDTALKSSYRYGTIKGISEGLPFVKKIDSFVQKKAELNTSSQSLGSIRIPGLNYAAAAPLSASDISAGSVSTDQANSSQSGLVVDTYPVGISVNPVTKKIYVTNEFSNSVSVISGTVNSVTNTIAVGDFPYGVAVNPFNSRVYVTNRGSDTVSVIDGSTNTKLDNITVQKSPVGIAVDPSADWIYITNINSDTVSVIDGITNRVTANIITGKIPYGVSLNPITKMVYVTNMGSNTISVIDEITDRVTANITVGKNPVGIAVNPITNTIFVTNYAANTVSVIDGSKDRVTANITVGKNPVGIAVNPITNKVYVTNIQSHTISVIDPLEDKVIATIAVNPSLSGSYRIHDPILSMPLIAKFPLIASLVAVNDVSNMIYVTNTGSDTVSIIDGNINSVVEKVNFNINPPNSGDIQCNGHQIVPNTFVLYRNGTNLQCNADDGQGYEFNSWSNMANGSSNPLNLKLSQYGGTITANFKQTLSFEQYLAIILGPISIISIVVGWIFRSRQRRNLNKYMAIIETAYETLYENNNTKDCLLHLQLIRKEITYLFGKGKISDGYYNILDRKISEYIEKINTSKS